MNNSSYGIIMFFELFLPYSLSIVFLSFLYKCNVQWINIFKFLKKNTLGVTKELLKSPSIATLLARFLSC